MNRFTAVMICEGVEDADEGTILEAWQQLIDDGTVWKLQDWFGRTAKTLIENGLCYAPKKICRSQMNKVKSYHRTEKAALEAMDKFFELYPYNPYGSSARIRKCTILLNGMEDNPAAGYELIMEYGTGD